MPEFDYVVIDGAGREKRGLIRAETATDARSALAAKKLFVVRIGDGRGASGTKAEGKARPARSLLSFERNRLSNKDLTLFTRQLSTLAQVSPLEEALRTITRQSEKPHVREIVSRVHQGVVEGRTLGEAMGMDPRSFPGLYRAMIAAGERSGSLPMLTERLAVLLERQAVMRSKLLTALAYPTVLAAFAVIVIISLMIFVVPLVVEQFDTLGQQLPLLTRIVMGISNMLASWWWAILILLVALGLIGWRALKNEDVRLRADAMLLGVPFVGRLLRDLHAARMARTLATMVQSRLPVMEGLSLTVPTIHNRVLRAATSEIVESVRGGGSLSAAMRRADVFPPLLVYLAASGESAGQLDLMLERAAEYLEREFDSFTAAALSMLEPLIIILMGGIVAIIILSILLPIMQLQNLTGAGV
ncbi:MULTISPECIES: type II secretion system inner membrane protein GspF [Sphingobium]|uniref:type II secretion system inner membrane protein GspF n=1 Tax=Sphingobium TaxID=165695 RepID=UPI0015EC8DE6|nr:MULTISPECIES: type II secretion system inner membrane protein GspF [Sphingobium]MCW2364433.1 general secretion pathway protein F [Sphingobium sp. B10D3B]MCW2402170.1 general secretion pathway protein F [Sphingobium sp. B10D7B]MCW2409149.1 general secretion pathway protein F [Sphingobium xanthum]